ncbi:hypothetical protein BB560_001044 [Smittium megazygosporum]|uniref:Uncharacterized protein n=1 Tax=Smittium megazygosporum TaxID=133381 RepID=A0A2T9ZIP3_9FUNG|nr:hypothetical protein BB560_001044 [Smittium megazygosporum]
MEFNYVSFLGEDLVDIPQDLGFVISPGPFIADGYYMYFAYGIYTISGISITNNGENIVVEEGAFTFANSPAAPLRGGNVVFDISTVFFASYDANGFNIGYNNTIIAQITNSALLDPIFSGGNAEIMLATPWGSTYSIQGINIFCESSEPACGISSTTDILTIATTETSSETSTTTNSIIITSTNTEITSYGNYHNIIDINSTFNFNFARYRNKLKFNNGYHY